MKSMLIVCLGSFLSSYCPFIFSVFSLGWGAGIRILISMRIFFSFGIWGLIGFRFLGRGLIIYILSHLVSFLCFRSRGDLDVVFRGNEDNVGSEASRRSNCLEHQRGRP